MCLCGVPLTGLLAGTSGIFNVAPSPQAAGSGDILLAAGVENAGPGTARWRPPQYRADRVERPVELIWPDQDWLVEQDATQRTDRRASSPGGRPCLANALTNARLIAGFRPGT